MAKKPDAAARRAAERKALNARLAAIRAEEELEALDGEEEPAPGEGGIERIGVFADGTDVVHAPSYGLARGAVQPAAPAVRWAGRRRL